MPTQVHVARNLAGEFLNAVWTERELVRRGATVLPSVRALRKVVRDLVNEQVASGRKLDLDGLTQWLCAHAVFNAACRRMDAARRKRLNQRPIMALSAGRPAMWNVPDIVTTGALADRFNLTPGQLDALADLRRWAGRAPDGPLRNYVQRWRRTASGKLRLLEVPKRRLKSIQRRILTEILRAIPVHDAAHGFRPGRSIVSYANPHVGKPIVVRFDLRDFFASITSSRVRATFQTAGYPCKVAQCLSGLCTCTTPSDVLEAKAVSDGRVHLERFARRHLPQGAPTSTALANCCAYRLDSRLAGLARALGAVYTRYADDLAFSGDGRLERGARRFQVAVCRIALEEGFEINTRKTRFMRHGVRQQLAGVVVNTVVNPERKAIDRLKAILTNCVRRGPQSQNRERRNDFRGHLLGRISYVTMLHRKRGLKLRHIFDRIDWRDSS